MLKLSSTAQTMAKLKLSAMIFGKIGDKCEGTDRTYLLTWEMKNTKESLEWSLVIYSATGNGGFPGNGCLTVIA